MWEKYEYWQSLIKKYNDMTVAEILKDREELEELLKK